MGEKNVGFLNNDIVLLDGCKEGLKEQAKNTIDPAKKIGLKIDEEYWETSLSSSI